MCQRVTAYHHCFCPSSWRWAVTSSRAPVDTCWTRWSRALHPCLGRQRKWFSKETRIMLAIRCRVLLLPSLPHTAAAWLLPVGGRIKQRNASLSYLNSLPVSSPCNYPSAYFSWYRPSVFALTLYFKKWIFVLNEATAGWLRLREKQPACRGYYYHIVAQQRESNTCLHTHKHTAGTSLYLLFPYS